MNHRSLSLLNLAGIAADKKHVDEMAGRTQIDLEDSHDREELIAQLVHLCDIGASTYMCVALMRRLRRVAHVMEAGRP